MSTVAEDQKQQQQQQAQWLEAATECLPTWACDDEYYEALIKYEKVVLKTDPIKGKGLFAREAIQEDDHVLVETALCCSQNVDDFEAGVNICGSCMKSLETPKDIIRRLCTTTKPLLNALPKNYAGFKANTLVGCKNASKGCTMVFCSDRCADDAWRKHHYVGCSGVMSAEAEKAYEELRTNGWVHNGVDLSDTVFLGFRFICFVLTRHRLHRMPLPLAWFPVGQLIRSPINKFSFSYLLQEEYEEAIMKNNNKKSTTTSVVEDAFEKKKEEDTPPVTSITINPNESEAEKRARRWKLFADSKDDPMSHPAVQFHLSKDDKDKVEFVKKGIELVHTACGCSQVEANFLSGELWSNLLGAILLNGQERSPNSQFSAFMSHWKKNGADGENAAKNFARLVREHAPGVSVRDFDTSTRGQGIYTVGSCFNHSCRPNLQIHYAGGEDEMLCAVALRDIEEGEELYISYIDEDLPIAERQQQLFEHYLFTCACEKCEDDKIQKAKHAAAADKKESTPSVSVEGEEEEK